MVDTGGTLHTAYISELGAKVGNYFGVVDSYGEVAMKHLFLGLDIQLAYVDGKMHRYHLYDFLQDAEPVDTLYAHFGKKQSRLLGPARAVSYTHLTLPTKA